MELRDIHGKIMGVISDAMMEGSLATDSLADAIISIPEIRDALGLQEWVGGPALYARDLDGTGSLHVCAKGDPGAIPLYR